MGFFPLNLLRLTIIFSILNEEKEIFSLSFPVSYGNVTSILHYLYYKEKEKISMETHIFSNKHLFTLLKIVSFYSMVNIHKTNVTDCFYEVVGMSLSYTSSLITPTPSILFEMDFLISKMFILNHCWS